MSFKVNEYDMPASCDKCFASSQRQVHITEDDCIVSEYFIYHCNFVRKSCHESCKERPYYCPLEECDNVHD